ncbi:hypothetical protein D3C78_961670 [compost metagenome]
MDIYGRTASDVAQAVRGSGFDTGCSGTGLLGVPFVLIVIACSFRQLPRPAVDTNLKGFYRIFTRGRHFYRNLSMNGCIIIWTNNLNNRYAGLWIVDIYTDRWSGDSIAGNNMAPFCR